MTPEQADKISDDLLEQRRRDNLAKRNAAARRVPFFYYVRGLNALEPWERAELLRFASRHVANDWRVAVSGVALAGGCCALWVLFGFFARNDVPPVLLVFVIAAAAVLPHAYFVRREIRKRLAQRQAEPSEGLGEA